MSRGLIAWTLALAVVLVGLAVHRVENFQDDVNEASAKGDDWLIYKQNAVSIVEGGLIMPSVKGNYVLPGGFLYNYLVAAVFAATGRQNASFVYVTQAALLAFSVGLMTAAFRDRLQSRTLWCFAIALAATAYIDVFRYYTFKLLSENLVLFCLAGWWLSLMIALRRNSSGLLFLVSGGILGVCILARQNLLPMGPIVVLILWSRQRRDRLVAGAAPLFACGVVLCASLIVVRNVAATGRLDLSVLAYRSYWIQPPHGLIATAAFYGKRALFPIGFLPLLSPVYSFRPHWMLAWAGVIAFCVARRAGGFELWELLVMMFIVAYLAPIVAVAEITNYGYRMILPVVPAVLLLAFRAVDLRLAPR